MGFPEYQSVTIKNLVSEFCRGNDVCSNHAELFTKHFIDKKRPKGDVDTWEVQKALQDMLFGKHPDVKGNAFLQDFFSYLRRRFFANSPFDGKHSTITSLVFPATAIEFKDADTFSLRWKGGTYTFRFGGIDAPESFVSSKLYKTIDYIFLYWIEHLGFRGDEKLTKAMIKNRIRYTGYLSGTIAKDLDKWIEEKGGYFNTGPSFDRTSQKPEMVNTLVLTDDFNRLLGIPGAGKPDAKRCYLAKYIEERLPELMKTKGMELYDYYHSGKVPEEYPHWLPNKDEAEKKIKKLISEGKTEAAKSVKEDSNLEKIATETDDGKKFLKKLNKSSGNKEVREALSPETLPNPSVIYSKENCKEMAESFKQFIEKRPDFRNDIQAMFTHIGTAWVYQKYANQDTPTLVESESIAMGPLHKSKAGEKSFGLWGRDIIFGYSQPNPEYSPVYKAYHYELGRGKELIPDDACDVLKRQGKDIYNHCP